MLPCHIAYIFNGAALLVFLVFVVRTGLPALARLRDTLRTPRETLPRMSSGEADPEPLITAGRTFVLNTLLLFLLVLLLASANQVHTSCVG
ncbi:MAG: hypothetical protein ACR2PM_01565 [Hyphomicrobiales bacterium]